MKIIQALLFFVLFFCNVIISQVTQECEPNNIISNSNDIGLNFNYVNHANSDISAHLSSITDIDIFKLTLAEGYHYSINYDMEDGNSNSFYDANVNYFYKIDDGEWSEVFTSGSLFNTTLYLAGEKTVYFMVETNSAVIADTGDYYLQLDVERRIEPYVTVSPHEITGTFAPIHQQIIVNATAPYTIASSCECAVLNKYSGNGIDTFYLDIDTNQTSYYRTIQITVTSGSTSKFIGIKQAPYIQPDRYESNDESINAVTIELSEFVNDTAYFEINEVNFHTPDDKDYYKLKFPEGFNYMVNFYEYPEIKLKDTVQYSCKPDIYARLNNSGSNCYEKLAAKGTDSVYITAYKQQFYEGIPKFGNYRLKGFVVRQTENILNTQADTFLLPKSPNSDQTLSIYSTTNWTSTDDASWVVIYYGNGSNNGSFKFRVYDNNTGEQRVAHITINTSSGVSHIVTIIQEGDVVPDEYEINDSELTATLLEYNLHDNKAIVKTSMVNLHSHYDIDYYKLNFPGEGYYNVFINKFDRDYNNLKNEDYSGKTKIKVKTGNGAYEESITHYTIKGNDSMYLVIDSYSQYDSGSYCLLIDIEKVDLPYLSISNDTLFLKQFSLDENYLIVNSNIAWKISNESNWIGINERYNDDYTKYGYFGNKNDFIKIDSEFENDDWARDGNIIITAEGFDPITVYVYQDSPYKLSFPSDTIELGASGLDRVKDFTVLSNIKWEAYSYTNWLSVSPDTCYYTDTITVTASDNNEIYDRYGEISFDAIDVDGYLSTRILKVKQSGIKSLLTISDSIWLENTANAADTILIISNTDWYVNVDQPWLRLINTSGKNDGEVICIATENTTGSLRKATITISGTGIVSQNIIVSQDAMVSKVSNITFIGVNIYPNPTKDKVHIDLNDINANDVKSLIIYDNSGKIIQKDRILKRKDSIYYIDLTNYVNGIYFIELYINTQRVTYKLIKE
ncbi:MAG: T9SS type A sorting domain-containing protein [Marinilabiliaceae bacterium]|nr:T9SS type A sorting domain-containing protein [Marinilabiliaceae bacterium]